MNDLSLSLPTSVTSPTFQVLEHVAPPPVPEVDPPQRLSVDHFIGQGLELEAILVVGVKNKQHGREAVGYQQGHVFAFGGLPFGLARFRDADSVTVQLQHDQIIEQRLALVGYLAALSKF